MPFDECGVDGALTGTPSVGLRVKKNTNELNANGFEAGAHVLVQGQNVNGFGNEEAAQQLAEELT